MKKIENVDYSILDQTKEHLSIGLMFDSNYKSFQGHFDDFKVLPAITHIEMIVLFFEEFFNKTIETTDIPKIKFSRPITPNMPLHLNISYDQLKSKITFEYLFEKHICSSGVLKV